MRLNIDFEYLPGQEGQVTAVAALLKEQLERRGIVAEGSQPALEEELSLYQLMDLRVKEAEALRDASAGAVFRYGNLPTYLAVTCDGHQSRHQQTQQAEAVISGLARALSASEFSPPDLIVLADRPIKKAYAELVKTEMPDLSVANIERLWKQGHELLLDITHADWLPGRPVIVVVDPARPDAAVKCILAAFTDQQWERYAASTVLGLTEQDRFMGKTLLHSKLPKRLVTSLEREAEAYDISLDQHLTAIIKKHLLGDISPPG